MTHIHGCKQTPATPPTTSDEDSSGSTSDGEMKKKKGNRAMGKKKFPKAIKYYTKAVKTDPENPTYRLNRAIANSALELWKDAEVDAEMAVELGDPPTAKSHYQLARARLKRGRVGAARAAVRSGLEANPSEAALLQLSKEIERACTLKDARERKEREDKASRGPPEAGPASATALLEQARVAYTAARLEECLRLCDGAQEAAAVGVAAGEEKAKNLTSSVCSLRGKAQMRLKRWQDAASAFQEAIDLQEATFSMMKPEEREALSNAYNNLGIAFKNSGKMDAAVEALHKAYMKATNGDDQMATPQCSQILQNVAQCHVQQDKIEEARLMYGRALEIGQRMYGPDHASHALNYLGIARCFKKELKIPDAIKNYSTAYQLWTSREPEVCLREMPEVPNKERLTQLQEQCRQELAELVLYAEELRRRQQSGDTEGTGSAAAAASGSADPPAESGAAAA